MAAHVPRNHVGPQIVIAAGPEAKQSDVPPGEEFGWALRRGGKRRCEHGKRSGKDASSKSS
jgi:hypothetical protein